ncbi:MAG: hypothetical protein ACJ8AG_15565 [Ktedonobacteraceae bacterium]
MIHGAAGRVGVFAVQLARWACVHVIGAASARNSDFLRELGANETLDYTTRRFEDNAFASHISSKESENSWVQKIFTDQIPFLAEAFDEVLRVSRPGLNHVCIGRLSHDSSGLLVLLALLAQ